MGLVFLVGQAPYSASLTCSSQSTTLPSSASWMAMWVMAVVGEAPCQCFSPGANQTTSPGRISSTGPPSRCAQPQPGGDDQRLAERMGVPGRARARLEGDRGPCTRSGARRVEQRVDAHRAGEPVARALAPTWSPRRSPSATGSGPRPTRPPWPWARPGWQPSRPWAKADAEARRLAEAMEQHDQLAGLGDDARHLSRLADMLNAFRNELVASVGPRLSEKAGALFAELTDHEYDELIVNPETYEIQLRDAGLLYGMTRFSGSETDLANLALRVAVSEQVQFQAGGAVGLLVLDEVFGPLDDERKERMLLALERLKNRFRQVLVVTHDNAIKEQLPNAIEVVKLPGRRATAHLLNN